LALEGSTADRLGAAAPQGQGRLEIATAQLVEFLAKQLVDEPDAVRVVRTERDDAVVLELHVAEADRGKVIGRQGRVVRALRTLVRASGARGGERTLLEIVE
jgi:predicted RNA-binding protein YlqC (UPF0109 family)